LYAGILLPAATATSVVMSTTILVSQATAKLTPSTTSLNVARILATAAAGGVVANLTAAGCAMRIVRINDFNA
jgi:hypothetical protein